MEAHHSPDKIFGYCVDIFRTAGQDLERYPVEVLNDNTLRSEKLSGVVVPPRSRNRHHVRRVIERDEQGPFGVAIAGEHASVRWGICPKHETLGAAVAPGDVGDGAHSAVPARDWNARIYDRP